MSKPNIEVGFFKRLLNSFTKTRYEKKKTIQEKYKQNWEIVKWRYRVGKIIVLSSIYYFGKHYLVDKYMPKDEIKKTSLNLKNEFIEFFNSQWGIYNDMNFIEFYKKKFENVSKFLQINIEKNIDFNENKEFCYLSKIVKILNKNLNNLKENENFVNLDLNEENINIDENKLMFIHMEKKYNKNELGSQYENMINFAENDYKKYLCQVIPNKNILLSQNLIEDSTTPEELAFIISFNLIEYFGNVNFYKIVKNDFINFFDKLNDNNTKYNNGKFREDLKYILNDIKSNGDIQTYLLYNPFLLVNFEDETKEIMNILSQRQLEINLKKISLALDLMNSAGFDVRNTSGFEFDRIYYGILDMTDKENEMKIKMEKYMKKKINDIIRLNVNNNKNLEEIRNIQIQWNNLKNPNFSII